MTNYGGTPSHQYKDPDDGERIAVQIKYKRHEYDKIVKKANGKKIASWLRELSLKD